MIMVIKMRLHTKFDGLSILELRVPMPWSATFDRRYTPFFLFLSLFFFLLILRLFISLPHISALPSGLDVHISLSALIYLEIWWSTVTRYGGWHILPIYFFTIYTICDGRIQFHFIYM